MKNNTFFIVCREQGEGFEQAQRPNRDRWGWEFADDIERTDYAEAIKDLREYQAAMPNHVVRLRCIPTDKTRYDYNENSLPESHRTKAVS